MNEPTYTSQMVVRLLRSYLDFRHTLLGESTSGQDGPTFTTPKTKPNESRRPLGMTDSGPPWPFLETRHARIPRDGKAKASRMLEIHVSMMDLEQGLSKLSDDDITLIYKYHLFQTHTLDELSIETGIKTKGGMSKRISQAVRRLTRIMESLDLYDDQR